jgi:hypothetical protein
MPGSPVERTAATEPPALYLCPHCGERHQPFPMATGMADLYGRSLLGDPGRPEPLGRSANADTVSLRRDAANPWHQP